MMLILFVQTVLYVKTSQHCMVFAWVLQYDFLIRLEAEFSATGKEVKY